MGAQIFIEHGNEAELSKYPFAGTAAMSDSSGRRVPEDFIVDAVLYPKDGTCSLSYTRTDGTACTVGVSTGGSVLEGTFSAGATVCELYDADGFHAGTVVFGRGCAAYVAENGERRFDSMPFCLSCQHAMGQYGVSSVSVDNGTTLLRGEVAFAGVPDSVARVETVVGVDDDAGESTLRFDVVPNNGVLSKGANGIRTIYVCRQPGSRFGVLRRGENGERPYLYLTRDGFFRQNSLLDRNLICANKNQVVTDYDTRSGYDDCGAAKKKTTADAVVEKSSWSSEKSKSCSTAKQEEQDPVKLYFFYHESSTSVGNGIGTRESIAKATDDGWIVPSASIKDLYGGQILDLGEFAKKPMTVTDLQEYSKLCSLFKDDRIVMDDKYTRWLTEQLGRRPSFSLDHGVYASTGPGGWRTDWGASIYLPVACRMFDFTRNSTFSCFFIEESVYVQAVASDKGVALRVRWHRPDHAARLFGYPKIEVYDSEEAFPRPIPSRFFSGVDGSMVLLVSRSTGKVYRYLGSGSDFDYVQFAEDYTDGDEYHYDYGVGPVQGDATTGYKYTGARYYEHPSFHSIVLRRDRYRDFFLYFYGDDGGANAPGKIGYLDYRKLFELCQSRGWLYDRWVSGEWGSPSFPRRPVYVRNGILYDDADCTVATLPEMSYVFVDSGTGDEYMWSGSMGLFDDDPHYWMSKERLAEVREELRQDLKTVFSGIDLTQPKLLYVNRARDIFEHFGCKNWEIAQKGHLGESVRYLVGWGTGSELWSGGNNYLKLKNNDGFDVYLPKWMAARYVWWKKYCRTGDLRFKDEEGPDVVRGYKNGPVFYNTPDNTSDSNVIVPDEGKLYIDLNTNFAYTFRWGEAGFVRKDWMRYFVVPEERGVCLYVGDYFRDGIRDHGREQSPVGWDCVGDFNFGGVGRMDSRDDDQDSYWLGYCPAYTADVESVVESVIDKMHVDVAPGYDPTDPDGQGPDTLFRSIGAYGAGDIDEERYTVDGLDMAVQQAFREWSVAHPFSSQMLMQPRQAPVASNTTSFWETGGSVYDEPSNTNRVGPFEYEYGRIYIEDKGYPDEDDPDGQALEREALENKTVYFFKYDLTKAVGNSFNFDTTDMATTDAVYDNPIHISIEESTDAPRTVDVKPTDGVQDITAELRKLTNRSTVGNGVSISIPGLL